MRHSIRLTLHRALWGVCVRMSSRSPWMVDVHVWIRPALLSSSFLSSLICLADLGKVSGGRSHGRFHSLSASTGRCRGACSLTHSPRTGMGLLGSKSWTSLTWKLHIVVGLVSSWWPSGSFLVLSILRRLTFLWGDAIVCVSEAPILVPRAGSAGNGGKAGGGCSGGLAPLPELPVPPSLS